MERRGSDRIRRPVPCSFELGGGTYEGLVADFSAGGLFLETDAGIALGVELKLTLREPGQAELVLRGQVVRRRYTPAVIARWIRRGVGVRIVSSPEGYRELLRGEVSAPDAAWSALRDLEPPQPPASAALLALDVIVHPDDDPRPPDEAPDPAWTEPAVDREHPDEGAPATPPEQPVPAAAPEARCRAEALLIHDGDLSDVENLLEGMGAAALSQSRIDASAFAGWERPPRLIVASGRSALRLSMGESIHGLGIVTIAVVESDSQTLCAMLRRQGFRYVVRRPVHPEALRLLLGRALFRGRERRDTARVSLGCEVGLRRGLRRKPATLLEVSRTGCRALVSEWMEPGARLNLRIPTRVTGNRPLALVGRVLRGERRARPGGGEDVAVAVRFDRLDADTRMRLDALIAANTLGPTPLEQAASSAGEAPTPSAPEAPRTPPAPPAAPISAGERRKGPRVPHRQEVIALEPELARVRHTLIGIDLSAGGIRVEPHPELTIGDRVRIAIYDAATNETLVLDAEATRDEGARGLVMQFRNVSGEVRRQIERVVAATPQIESAGSAPGSGVVVAEMIAQQPA
jgi:hypothetical protein